MITDKPGISGVGALLRRALALLLLVVTMYQCRTILTRAYTIRLHSIETYGYSGYLLTFVSTFLFPFLECLTPSRLFSHHGQSSTNLTPTSTSALPNTCTTMDGKTSSNGLITRYGTPLAVPLVPPSIQGCKLPPCGLSNHGCQFGLVLEKVWVWIFPKISLPNLPRRFRIRFLHLHLDPK